MGGRTDDPRAFHRTSLVLHALNAALIVLVLHRLFGLLVPAALVGLAFGLHPLTVEPVAWIADRKTLLATSLALGSVLAYVGYVRENGRARLLAAVALYAAALLAKPSVVMIPLLLLILDVRPLRRFAVGGPGPPARGDAARTPVAAAVQRPRLAARDQPGSGPARPG